MKHIDAGHQLKQFSCHVRHAADAGRTEADLPGIGLCVADELGNIIAGLTTSTKGTVTSPATAATSRLKLKVSPPYSVALIALTGVTNSNVCPSGGALMTDCAAKFVPAPGLFSTMTCWPRRSDSHGAMILATMSVEPPGGNPTTHRMGRLG
jgi:hypothetical protein